MSVELSNVELGRRLRIARERAGTTQAQAADAVAVARTTLIAIEGGKRRARLDEIRRLARNYGESVNGLLIGDSAHIDLLPRFRKIGLGGGREKAEAAEMLIDLVKAEVDLERVLGVVRSFSYPAGRPIMSGDVRAQAAADAAELRQRLGLGLLPVRDMVTLLEIDLGVRVYIRPVDSSVAGLFAYDDSVGACMLLNAKHPRERRAQTAAHELGHLVSCRQTPAITYDGMVRSREERYADAFGRAFLMPTRTVTHRFADFTKGTTVLTRRHVILMAHCFGVSREALVRRLEELQLVRRGAWDWFKANGGITDKQAKTVLEDLVSDDVDQLGTRGPGTLRLNLLAAEAHRQGLMSEGQLARLLRLDRVALRDVLDIADVEGDADGIPKLSR